jgi:hypothetical protein
MTWTLLAMEPPRSRSMRGLVVIDRQRKQRQGRRCQLFGVFAAQRQRLRGRPQDAGVLAQNRLAFRASHAESELCIQLVCAPTLVRGRGPGNVQKTVQHLRSDIEPGGLENDRRLLIKLLAVPTRVAGQGQRRGRFELPDLERRHGEVRGNAQRAQATAAERPRLDGLDRIDALAAVVVPPVHLDMRRHRAHPAVTELSPRVDPLPRIVGGAGTATDGRKARIQNRVRGTGPRVGKRVESLRRVGRGESRGELRRIEIVRLAVEHALIEVELGFPRPGFSETAFGRDKSRSALRGGLALNGAEPALNESDFNVLSERVVRGGHHGNGADWSDRRRT